MGKTNFKYMVQLDGVRLLAVTAVVIASWTNIGSTSQHYHPISSAGIDLFFVLSGFLLTGILFNSKEQAHHSRWQLLKLFYIRRMLRLLPLYFLLLIAGFVCATPSMREDVLWYLSFTGNFHIAWQEGGSSYFEHLWPMAVAVQFYLFFPIVVLFTPRRLYLTVFSGLIVWAILSRMLPYLQLNDDAQSAQVSSLFTPGCFDALAIGAILAYFHRYRPDRLQAILQRHYLYFGALLVFLLLSYFGWYMPNRTVFSIFCFWLVGMAATRGFTGRAQWLLENRVTVFLGKISFGLYMFHNLMPWLFAMMGLEDSWATRLLYPVATVLIATVSWYLYEKPVNDLRQFFEYRPAPAGSLRSWQVSEQLLRVSVAFLLLAIIFAVGFVCQYRGKLLATF